MKRILLLVENRETLDRLSERLSEHYQIILSDTETFDLCVTDSAGLNRGLEQLGEKQQKELPALLPVLLVGEHAALEDLSDAAQSCIDDMIVDAFQGRELSMRVENLLRLRHFSLRLKYKRERLLRISTAIDSASEAISITDMNNEVVYHNKAFTNLYGYSVDDLNERGFVKTLFIRPAVIDQIYATMESNQQWSGEVQLRKKTGQIVPTLLRTSWIEDDEGCHTGLIAICTDITARKQAEAAERRQWSLAEALRDIAAVLTSTLELEEVMERILANVGRVVIHDAANVMLVHDNTASIVRSRGYEELGLDEQVLCDQRLQVAEAPALHWMAETGQPLIVPDIHVHSHGLEALASPELRSYVGAPIRLKGRVIGFLNLGSKDAGFFTPVHADRLQTFAEQAAIAIQNAQLHEKERALAALQERQRLARILHDAVNQTLFSASMIAEALPRIWDREPDRVRGLLVQLHRLTRGAMAEMRTLLLELRPAALLETDIDDLLRQLTEAVMGRTKIKASLTVQGEASVPKEVQIALYYIAHEGLSNIAQHSHATQAELELYRHPQHVQLNISDNGRGFEHDQISATALGLDVMREHAEMIGASLMINTHVGRGTQIELEWPGQKTK